MTAARKPPHPLMPWILGPDHAPEPAPPIPRLVTAIVAATDAAGVFCSPDGSVLATGPKPGPKP